MRMNQEKPYKTIGKVNFPLSHTLVLMVSRKNLLLLASFLQSKFLFIQIINFQFPKFTKSLIDLSDADSCSLNAAVFTSQNEIFTGNSRGMIKLWDLRSISEKPILSTSLSEDSEVTRQSL